MGVAITELLIKKEIELEDLSGKIIAVDAPMFLYQFLSTIRSPDGTPLTDSKGNVTSHLAGIFYRTASLIQKGLKLVYVFDGKPPELKAKEIERRKGLKVQAKAEYEIAKERQDIESMKKFASRTSRIDAKMLEETKELIAALGVPFVEAPSEAEAQASHMVANGDAFAVATQDADTMMFGAPRIIRNLSIAGKRKKANKLAYEIFKPESIILADNLANLGIDREQLIMLCILVGTDFNIGGIKGIGPKKAIDLVKKSNGHFDAMFENAGWEKNFNFPWMDVYNTILNIPIRDDYNLSWGRINEDKVKEILIHRHEFGKERIEPTLEKIRIIDSKPKQKGLSEFF